MKQKLFLLFFALTLLLPINKVFAYDYTIKNYDVKIDVKENNVLDVTETIDVNFEEYRHGIYRIIPVNNKVYREDGTSESNHAKITDLKVSEEYETSYENGNKKIQIGSASDLVIGGHQYVISYSYDLEKDRNKKFDELYYNIIGTNWTTTIDKVSFTINMPKSFDESKLGFSVGSYGISGYENKLNYTVDGTTITGTYIEQLGEYEGINIRLELDEGYFKVEDRIDVITILMFIIPILFSIVSFLLWFKYGKDDPVVETVEFYPPGGFNSLELAQIYKGKASAQDVTSLVIYLANKGYLKIEEFEKKSFIKKKKTFRIIKIKDYDGNNEHEKKFFDRLFDLGHNINGVKVVEEDDLKECFYTTVYAILASVNSPTRVDKIYESTFSKKALVFLMIFLTLILITLKPLYEYFGYMNVQITSIFQALAYNKVCLAGFVVGLVGIGIMVALAILLQKRTPYGIEMLGKIEGFKNFMEAAEKDKLEALVEQDPSYFYDILPYAYVLGVSNKWIKKFESISVEPPEWYVSPDPFDIILFHSFMDRTMASAQSSMTSSPQQSSSGGGGFSGGGFSGGGSGGGGGGSW